MTDKTYRITSTSFVANITINRFGVVTRADPDVAYMAGWHSRRVQTYVDKMAWRIVEVQPQTAGEVTE